MPVGKGDLRGPGADGALPQLRHRPVPAPDHPHAAYGGKGVRQLPVRREFHKNDIGRQVFMLPVQQLLDRPADDPHLGKVLPRQPHDVGVSRQQPRGEAEGEVHRHVGGGGVEHGSPAQPLLQVVVFRLFLQQRRLPAPEAEGGRVRVFPLLPQHPAQVVQEGDHPVVKGPQGLQRRHALRRFRPADHIRCLVRTEPHRYRCTP